MVRLCRIACSSAGACIERISLVELVEIVPVDRLEVDVVILRIRVELDLDHRRLVLVGLARHRVDRLDRISIAPVLEIQTRSSLDFRLKVARIALDLERIARHHIVLAIALPLRCQTCVSYTCSFMARLSVITSKFTVMKR